MLVTLLCFHFHSNFHGNNPTLRRTTTKTVKALWPGKPCALPNLFFLSFVVARTASEVQTKGWDEMTETMFFWDVNYLIPFTQGQVLAFLCLFFPNLPCNMLKNYRFLLNIFACCLPFLRAKKSLPHTTKLCLQGWDNWISVSCCW